MSERKLSSAYAPVCAEKGIVTLAIDSWCFGERKHETEGRTGEEDAFKLMLWRGQVLWGMMMFDEFRALDYLAGRAEVDPQRLGALGMSMGSTKAWWLAALDPRVCLCVDICCLTDYEELIRTHNLKGHGIYYYVPSLLKHFQTSQINELIVPRPRLSVNGRQDGLTPPAGGGAGSGPPACPVSRTGEARGLPDRAFRLRPRRAAGDGEADSGMAGQQIMNSKL